MRLRSLHHVTCVCSAAQRTVDFYRDRLGFSLVKKTVNFDDPHSYHLYFGDEGGTPGTLLTFFEWPRAERGRRGRGTLESVGIDSPAISAEQTLEDPDGLALRVHPGERVRLRDVTVIGNPDLYAGLFADDAPLRFAEPADDAALIGAGATHHVAWRIETDADLRLWLDRLTEVGLGPSAVQDRKYFHSIYFRLPDGVLIEIATDRPGFGVDEAPGALGRGLALPEWLEPERATLERELAPIV
jgi:glyoxalase family protein